MFKSAEIHFLPVFAPLPAQVVTKSGGKIPFAPNPLAIKKSTGCFPNELSRNVPQVELCQA